jgi:phage terminase small subunit
MSYWLPMKLERKLDEYRARRKVERNGRVLTRAKAIDEILEAALYYEPDAKKLPTFEQVVERLERLEANTK